ncbi:hypothetical protein KDL44_09425 [bacterium]|nr:hypothetical protein [bacterium]
MRVIHVLAAAVLAVVLFVACGGGGGSQEAGTRLGQPQPAEELSRGTLNLAMDSRAGSDGTTRVLLKAEQASDLYQIAGTLQYDPGLYELLLVEAGGGLGSPEEAYFLDGEGTPGRIDFAYTRRYFGAGISGEPLLLSVKVRPLGNFSLSDFSLDTSAGSYRLRDSHKQDMEFTVEGREVGNE